MKKFAKLSLVAAVAVTSMVTASAKDLTEAIKGVDVSGTTVYRYDDKSTTGSKNDYKIGITAKAKVNDDITAVTRVLAAGDKNAFDGNNHKSTERDSAIDVSVSNVYFMYNGLENTTVSIGKQGIATPFTKAIDSDGSEQTGSGISATTKLGMLTATASYFNTTNLSKATDNEDLMVAGLMGSFSSVKAEAWYIDLADHFNQYFVKASAKVGPV